jgi:molecular chaperone GrpE
MKIMNAQAQPKNELENNEELQASGEAASSPLTQEGEPIELSSEAALKAEIARLTEENAKIKDQALRALAEAENTRKRAQRDIEEGSKYAVTRFATDLVGVIENLQRASQSIPEEARISNEMLKNLGGGVDMVMREMLGIFERNGIRRIDPLGEKFDHNFHQAVIQIENPDVPVGTILQVLQAGYIIHDRLLKPAMVSVSKQGDLKKQADIKA